MFKKLDGYTTKTFLGPFFFIFSVLFFIFIVQFAWQEMERFAGKGLSWLTIAELLFYLGINVIQLVLPLSILLGTIMTYGGFAEKYELAAVKASGISLVRLIAPLFVLVCMMSVGLYYFGDYIMPYSQRKAKNMAYNIVKTNPTLQLVEGVFIESIPGYSMKISEISGEEQDQLKDVFISQEGKYNDDRRTIIADHGTLNRDKDDLHLLKMVLYQGTVYVDQIKDKNHEERKRQPNQKIKFDTLVQYIDISQIIQEAMDEENIQDHFKFLNAKKLKERNDSMTIDNTEYYQKTYETSISDNIYDRNELVKNIINPDQKKIPTLEELPESRRFQAIKEAINQTERKISSYKWTEEEINWRVKQLAKQKIHYNRNFTYAFTCIIFFLVGAPLGAIVKKGGVGMPVVISIIIFVLYYIINFSTENMAENGDLDPTFAAWSANLVFFPIAVILLYKANNDSALFNLANYLDPIVKFFSRFNRKKNNEHSRYQ